MKHDPLCRLRKDEKCSGIGGVDRGHYTDRPVCRNCGATCTCDMVREVRASMMGDESEDTITERGFRHAPARPGAYGGEVKVYESSAASSPHLWINLVEDEESAEATIHLTVENALLLAGDIRRICALHYQGSDEGE